MDTRKAIHDQARTIVENVIDVLAMHGYSNVETLSENERQVLENRVSLDLIAWSRWLKPEFVKSLYYDPANQKDHE